MLEWTAAKHANGPKISAWLRAIDERNDYIEPTKVQQQSTSKSLSVWGSGVQASIWTLDAMLTRRGMHLAQVPNDFWEKQNHYERGAA